MDHRETFLLQYERRFAESHGPLPQGTEDALEQLLRCGDPHFGVTLLHCPDCKLYVAVPFSCKHRACPSCTNRRAEDVSHRLVQRLPQVAYRHVVITLPKKMGLRKRFQQDPRLYRQTSRLLHRLLSRWIPAQVRCHRNKRDQKARALPGILMSVQSFGSGLKTHPHFHLLVSDGAFFPDDDGFYPLGVWDADALTEQVRTCVLQSLVARGYLRNETADILRSWPLERSGFSVFVGEPLTIPEQESDVRRVLRYIFRSSLPLNRLHYEESTGRVQYRDPHGPWKTWDHAIEFLAAFVQHIPRARQHQVTYAGYFANAMGKLSEKPPAGAESPKTGSSRYTRWAALVLRTWATDPEACPKCGKAMQRRRSLFDRQELLRLLGNLGIGDYPKRPRSPPPPPEVEDDISQEDPSRQADGPQGWPEDADSQVPPDWETWDAA